MRVFILLIFVFLNAFASSQTNQDSVLIVIENYLLEKQNDSAQTLLAKVEILDLEYLERLKTIAQSKVLSYEDYYKVLTQLQRTRPDVSYREISELIDREVKKPESSSAINYYYVKIKWLQITELRNLSMLDQASDKNEKLQQYINQFDSKDREVQRAQILADNHTSVLYLIQQDIENGMELAKKNEQLARKINDTDLVILSLYQQSDFLVSLGDIDEYIAVSEKSLELDELKKVKSSMYRSTISHLIDAYIFKRGNEERVKELLLKLDQSSRYKTEAISLYGKILNYANPEETDIQFVLDRFGAKTVLEVAEKAIEETENSEDKNAYSHVIREFAGALANYGYKEQSEKYYNEAIKITQQIYSQELSQSLANYETKQIRKEKELAIAYEQKQVKLYALIAILALSMFVITIFAFVKKKKQARLLAEKNIQIETTLKEKQLLLKEVHHRVKNNFQIISSLLELQSKGIEDEKARELAAEGKNRVKSMALIHQKLYQNDDLLIQFADYIERLVEEISKMYGEGKNTKMSYKIEDIAFDIDTAIPLGLIVNELITNAFKYGGNSINGNIEVSIRKKDATFYELTVKDNGKGMPEGFDISKARSLGLRLVKSLTKQLHGTVSYQNLGGTIFSVSFKNSEARQLVQ